MNWYKKTQSYPLEDPPQYSNTNYKDIGGEIVYMSPDEFLSKTRILKIDEGSRDNIDDLKSHILAGRKLDPPELYIKDEKVVNHDGRHRAIAAKELGINSIPCLIIKV